MSERDERTDAGERKGDQANGDPGQPEPFLGLRLPPTGCLVRAPGRLPHDLQVAAEQIVVLEVSQ
jgi:hypothetical protein